MGLLGDIANDIGFGVQQIGDWIGGLWKDYTGQSAVEKQNEANLDMAKYQAQMQEEFYNKYSSPQALMRQYKEAGLNPNLVYGSASAGQSNVPGFNAPHVERNLSGSDKLNKALSVMSAVQGVMQGVYQTTAAREAAEQSAITTMHNRLGYFNDLMDYQTNAAIRGYYPSMGWLPTLFRRSSVGRSPEIYSIDPASGSVLGSYIRSSRESAMNRLAQDAMSNIINYGRYWDIDKGNRILPTLGTYQIRRSSEALDYELKSELRNMGTYGKLAIAFLNLLK